MKTDNYSNVKDFSDQFENIELDIHGVRLPEFEIDLASKRHLGVSEDASNYDFLKALALNGFKTLNINKTDKDYKKYVDRAKYELHTLKELGFTGIADSKMFGPEDLNLTTLDAWAPILEPYYLTCKAKRYFHTLDARRVITLLRHLLPYHGFRLQTYERLQQGRKRTVYQIHPATPRLLAQGEEIRVLFL
jgi:hypothetical protein